MRKYVKIARMRGGIKELVEFTLAYMLLRIFGLMPRRWPGPRLKSSRGLDFILQGDSGLRACAISSWLFPNWPNPNGSRFCADAFGILAGCLWNSVTSPS